MGDGRRDLADTPLPAHVIDLGEEITDLADTAAIMAGLDVIISPCTAPLHLAGAMGRRAWAMIPFAPHFPWLLDREDSPWYPSMRLYRQSQPGTDWVSVVDQIARDLRAMT
jgi:ADP-heptose:LPS heptosyltransferase